VTLAQKHIEGLNFLLHGAQVLDLVLDPAKRLAVVTIAPTTTPRAGPIPTRASISLLPVSSVVVVLKDLQGHPPVPGMDRVRIDELGSLVTQFTQPLAGWDFIDNQRNFTPGGQRVCEWFDPAMPASEHTLSFFYGVRSAEGASALLLFLFSFDNAIASHPNGQAIPVESFAASGTGWKAIGSGVTKPVTILPDAVPPRQVDGELLGLIFVDAAQDVIVSYAVGKANWDGRRLRWSTSDGGTYDIPGGLTHQIRPRIPSMNRDGTPLEDFSYFALVGVTPDVSRDPGELVRLHLERSRSV